MQESFAPTMAFRNREGYTNFDFALYSTRGKRGTTALMRVKNEESKIHFSLSSILDVFDEIVLVDNGSTDRTAEIARNLKAGWDHEDRIKILSYPFKIARCGKEHSLTAENSVHSLVYYYNWCLSKCSFRYVCKWDGDMVLDKASKAAFKDFLKEMPSERIFWMLEGQTIYRDTKQNLWLAKGEVNREPMLFPYGHNPRFFKTELYEMLVAEPPLQTRLIGGVLFFELKFADEDEFSHWSTTDIPTERKRRELENFNLIREGNFDQGQFERLPGDFLDHQLR